MKLLKVLEAAHMIETKPSCFYSPLWRARVGLRAVRIGRSLRFREADLLRLIDKGTERLPEGYEGRR